MSVLLVCVVSWAVAQLIKVVFGLIKEKRIDWRYFVSAGGMPSAHSATVCALSMGMGLSYGFTSAVFDISTIFAVIVMYDAAGVRRAVSRQAIILNRITKELKEHYPRDHFERELRELWGHTPYQVFVGAVLGVAIATIWIGI